MGALTIIALIALAWTVLELFNPEHQSVVLAAVGFRAYWLWWLAPPLIAHVLREPKERSRAIYVLLATSAVVAILAAVQFAAPADSAINVYSYVDGEQTEGADRLFDGTSARRVHVQLLERVRRLHDSDSDADALAWVSTSAIRACDGRPSSSRD